MKAPKKISKLPGVSIIKDADLFAIVQDSVTSKITFGDLNAVISATEPEVTGGTYNFNYRVGKVRIRRKKSMHLSAY